MLEKTMKRFNIPQTRAKTEKKSEVVKDTGRYADVIKYLRDEI